MIKKSIVWFSEVDKDDIALVGGKGANLGEMTKAGFPVPPGFIITSQAYYQFIKETRIQPKIYEILKNLDVSNSKKLESAAAAVQRTIIRSSFPDVLARDIIKHYLRLDGGVLKNPLVAVRSSATAEDLPTASFAGQQSTFLNVQGEANLIEKVKEAWASLFTARAIFYRATNKFDHFKVGIAVPVQKMISSDTSGIMFTIDPVSNDKSVIVIEAIYGLGELIVQGSVTPDHYEVDKASGRIKIKTACIQEKIMKRVNTKTVTKTIPKFVGQKQKITDAQILKLMELGKKLERHYYFPQDVEWAIEKGNVYIVQTRPVTTTGVQVQKVSIPHIPAKQLILTGDPASPGIASGPAQYIASARQIHMVQKGEVLIAQMTNPDYVPAMRKAVAIVTDQGGRTSHAAIVSRELGIPAVVGAKGIIQKVKTGTVITVNGSTGAVYRGGIPIAPKVSYTRAQTRVSTSRTATKVYVNLAEPGRAAAISKSSADGVGLLRAEFMIADIGVHPRYYIKQKKQNIFIKELADKLEIICAAFYPRPVIYRATDFRSNEYRNLKGGSEFEPHEENPMLGFRGASRYIADSQVFDLEIEALKLIRNKRDLKNLSLMIPFVRTPKELLDVKRFVASNGLMRSPSFKLWMMVELPTNAIMIDKFLDIGIDGVSIGSNDLTMLILGTDRDNSEVAHIFSELDDAVLWAIERTIRACVKRGVTSSICGQAPSDYPELVEKLVSWGITSISVNPDVIEQVRDTVYAAEQKLGRNRQNKK